MLSGIRVLEISDPSTMLAGQILGDLGADVITVEPPEGAHGRRYEPFIEDIPGIDRSLTWHALNRNKRAMTLRADRVDGRALLTQLAQKSDIVLEAIGVNRPALLAENELPAATVHCTISAFSRDGPKAVYHATDLILMAASGAPALAGETPRPPLFFPVQQAMMEAGAEAAVAALAGLAARERNGEGQQVNISARTAAIMGALGRAIAGFAGDTPAVRTASIGSDPGGQRSTPNIYRCIDGFMVMSIAFGAAFGSMTRQMARWAIDEGGLSPSYAETNWESYRQAAAGTAARAAVDDLIEAVTTLCQKNTKAQLAKAAREYKFMAAPVNTMEDISTSRQFLERGLFAAVDILPEHRDHKVPVRFIQFSNYSIEVRRPAPRLSEHTVEILRDELGLTLEETQALFVHGVI